jgi:hypothetical protein
VLFNKFEVPRYKYFPEESATRDPFERTFGRDVAASSSKSCFKGIPRRRLLGKVVKKVGDIKKPANIAGLFNRILNPNALLSGQ